MDAAFMKYLKKRITFSVIFIVIFRFYRCPVHLLFHIKCPGCGMTRAILSFLRLDIRGAFQYHNLFPLVILSVIYFLFREKLYIGKRAEMILLIVFLFLFILRWCFCIV